MFTRTESFRQFIRYYPGVSLITGACLFVFTLLHISILPGKNLFTLLSGVNLLIDNGEYWRLFTPIFVHASFPHLLFNCFTLIIIGPSLENLMGTMRFLLLFFLSGILANVLTFLAMPLMYVHVGASGAIFGLFGCYAYILLYRKEIMSKQNAQTILVLIIIGVVMTFFQTSINIMGHIGGLLIGLAFSPLLFPKNRE